MTQNQYVVKRKLNIPELGETPGRISEACGKSGVSRQPHCDIKTAVEEEGLEGLPEKSRKAPRIANRVSPEVEQKVLDYSLEFPARGQKRAASELKKQGIRISDGGIRSVWLRHNLQIARLRLKRLEKWSAENEGVLAESQAQALEQAKEEKEAHGEIETPHPGFLPGQDACQVGCIKGIGKICRQTAIDTHSNVGFAKNYTDKTARVAADFLNDTVFPFFDARNMALLRILTGRGAERRGRTETRPCQLFLHLSGIECSKTKARHPQTNGSTERLNQTIQNEFYKVAFRKKLCKSLEEIQKDLDGFMPYYNHDRASQGKHCQGRTPMQTFQDGKPLCQQYVFENSEKGKTAA